MISNIFNFKSCDSDIANNVLNIRAFIATIAFAFMIAGCSGGGGSAGTSGSGSNSGGGTNTTSGTSGSSTAVGSLIADATSGFLGNSFTGAASSVAASNTASVYEDNYVTTATANTYTDTFALKSLLGTTWTSSIPPYTLYELGSSGWVTLTEASTTTMVDSGNGINISETDGSALSFSLKVIKTDLTGTTFASNTNFGCGSISGSCSGTYPSGSTLYTINYVSDFPVLYGSPNLPVTDTSGVNLTALPTVGTTTFCDPNWGVVFQPILSPSATANYNVLYTPLITCSSSDINNAITTGAVVETVLLSVKTASNTAATKGLLITNETAALGLNSYLFGLVAGNVIEGYLNLAGSLYFTTENKTAINSELSVDGLTLLP